MTKLDPRLHAHRPDLADVSLTGKVDAERFVEPKLMQVIEPIITVHKAPRFDAMQLTQALFGEMGRLARAVATVDASALSNRQRRQIEIPFEAGVAFDMVEAAIRELPGIGHYPQMEAPQAVLAACEEFWQANGVN